MIDIEYGKFYLACDICGNEISDFENFDEAVEYKKENGWQSKKGETLDSKMDWVDICPDCQD